MRTKSINLKRYDKNKLIIIGLIAVAILVLITFVVVMLNRDTLTTTGASTEESQESVDKQAELKRLTTLLPYETEDVKIEYISKSISFVVNLKKDRFTGEAVVTKFLTDNNFKYITLKQFIFISE